jgi:4-amino-4-deoxy-L-arabinose transferase-like glycosyltransferase
VSRAALRIERVAVATLGACILFIVLFWRLGIPSFWDPDEAHYAETTREMVATGDWLAPFYNELPFFDKPAFFHWLQGASMVLFGPTEFAARLVPALGALALIAVTVWFGSTVGSRRAGPVGGLILAVSPAVFGLARYAILDTVFTAFVFGGAALLAAAALRDRPRLQWPGYVALAFAVLTKGPLALVLCGLTFLLACLVSADLRPRLLGLRWILGLALIVAIAGPWFIYMYVRFGQDFVNGYALDENLRLFAASRFANQPGPMFYLQILAVGFLPWTGLLLGRLVDHAIAVVRGERLDPAETLLWLWTLVIVAFFSASRFKLDHYVFPAAPALCVLGARAWDDLQTQPLLRRHVGARFGAFTIGPVLIAIGCAIGYLLVTQLALPRAALWVSAAIVGCGVVALTLIVSRLSSGRRSGSMPWLGSIALAATYAGIILFALPALEEGKVAPHLARFVVSTATAGDRVASYRLNRLTPAFRFYVNRHMQFLHGAAEAEAFFTSGEPFLCAMAKEAYDEFVAKGVPLAILYQREGMWVTSGRALSRDREPLTQFVVVGQAR